MHERRHEPFVSNTSLAASTCEPSDATVQSCGEGCHQYLEVVGLASASAHHGQQSDAPTTAPCDVCHHVPHCHHCWLLR
eukprot:4642347-Alexandrium_andersonii.AAC.1